MNEFLNRKVKVAGPMLLLFAFSASPCYLNLFMTNEVLRVLTPEPVYDK